MWVASFMQFIRRVVYLGKDPSNVADALRNYGQLEWTGRPADPAPFQGQPSPSAVLDPDALPWELRDDTEAP